MADYSRFIMDALNGLGDTFVENRERKFQKQKYSDSLLAQQDETRYRDARDAVQDQRAEQGLKMDQARLGMERQRLDPEEVRLFRFAKQNGYQGGFMEWRSMNNPPKAPDLETLYDEGTGQETKAKWNPQTGTYDRVGGVIGGANQAGGAKFAAKIIGNAQQEKNLEAAVRALPAGEIRWRGFERLMEVFKATGKRQPPNSATEFNRRLTNELERGGLPGG